MTHLDCGTTFLPIFDWLHHNQLSGVNSIHSFSRMLIHHNCGFMPNVNTFILLTHACTQTYKLYSLWFRIHTYCRNKCLKGLYITKWSSGYVSLLFILHLWKSGSLCGYYTEMVAFRVVLRCSIHLYEIFDTHNKWTSTLAVHPA